MGDRVCISQLIVIVGMFTNSHIEVITLPWPFCMNEAVTKMSPAIARLDTRVIEHYILDMLLLGVCSTYFNEGGGFRFDCFLYICYTVMLPKMFLLIDFVW